MLAAFAFASANIDDIFVLIGFFANPSYKRGPIVIGQYIGFGSLTVTALACSFLAVAIPGDDIRWLGVLPIVIGLWHLAKAWRHKGDHGRPILNAGALAALGVASVTIADGADDIAVFVPLFSRQPLSAILLTCVIFAIMTGLWCLIGLYLTDHPKLRAPMQTWGRWITPVVLIGLGAIILAS
jgi:cadmium resistance protein CadD (predicted permease)